MPARWRKSARAPQLYGFGHREIRRHRVAAHRPGDPCAIGGEPLWQPAALLDLAHDHATGGYLPGLACRYHNRREGAIRGNAMRRWGRPPRRW